MGRDIMKGLIFALLLIAAPALADDTQGLNYHFSHQDSTGTQASASYNPDAPGTGWSYTYDSGNTQNSDGSWTLNFGGENGISYRTPPVYDE